VTTDVDKMVDEGLIIEVELSVFRYDYAILAGSSSRIINAELLTSILVDEGADPTRRGTSSRGETLQVVGPR